MGMEIHDAKWALLFLSLFALVALLGAYALNPPPCAGCNAKVSFVFSPDAEGEVVSFLRSAEKSIDIEMYVFTSEDIIRELADAKRRGVRVRVILEPRIEDSRKERVFALLSESGVEARWASFSYKLTHSKFVIVDGRRALVGSINFSQSALNLNREAAVAVEGEKVAELSAVFEEDWEKAGAAFGR
ncbi:MAG: phospholipase D-like domain-containing protein [Candidatus Micrarchaeia archaeon]